ncbi:MAG: ABC transporter substrate-binding protein [Candidatus Dormibacteraeota bacterium]|nr:ABC transporter substrate-binding protein [Candidatus Dormibacteraeota bacterium]
MTSLTTNRRTFLLGTLAAGASTALAAGGDPVQAARDRARKQGLITANLGITTGINASEIYYGQAKKIWQKHGIDPKPLSFADAVTMRDSLISGKIDLAAQAPFHVYISQLKGIPLKIVGNRRNIVDITLVVQAGEARSIRTVADLKGRKIGVATIGAWDWGIVYQYLHRAGLDPRTAVSFVAGQNGPQLLAAKQVDAAEGNAPQVYQMLDSGTAKVLINPFDPAVHQHYFGARRVMSRAWLTHQNVIDHKPHLIKGVIAATNEIFSDMLKARTSTLVDLLKPYYPDATTSQLQRGVDNDLKHAIPSDSAMSRAAYYHDQQIFINAGLVARKVPFSRAVDAKWAGATE